MVNPAFQSASDFLLMRHSVTSSIADKSVAETVPDIPADGREEGCSHRGLGLAGSESRDIVIPIILQHIGKLGVIERILQTFRCNASLPLQRPTLLGRVPVIETAGI